ncbi:unnamed protein product [Protopolystoma xenopodis]|uniref:Ubiquitin-like domain-containing protein n=1 Tax=Protopolystoma xenopodis TaxID=117903 RepID=A0A448WKL3_9PLAT|nr:unnamed protein product [Protopolystoma xenopodis]
MHSSLGVIESFALYRVLGYSIIAFSVLLDNQIWHNLNLSQKVGQVKKKILGLFGIEASRANQFLLVYWDSVMSSIQGPEELKFPGRAIHSYQPEEGDTFELCRLHKL